MKNALVLMSLFIGMFIISCELMDDGVKVGEYSTNIEVRTSGLDFSYFGTSHNDMLDYATGTTGFDTATREDVYDRVINYSDQ